MSNVRALPNDRPRGKFLVVDPADASARSLARWIRTAGWEPVVAKTLDLDEAASLRDDCGGAILSLTLDLPGGPCWQNIRACQAVLPAAPVAVVGDQRLAAVAQTQAPGVHYIYWPGSFASVFSFADSVRSPQKGRAGLENVDDFAKHLDLTRRQTQILIVSAETSNHKDICASLVMGENTLRTHVKRMLARARDRGIHAANLKELVARIPKGTTRR
jgi:DNA-binding NarL/FixJ family response regulator